MPEERKAEMTERKGRGGSVQVNTIEIENDNGFAFVRIQIDGDGFPEKSMESRLKGRRRNDA